MFCVNTRQTWQKRLKPACPIQNEELLQRGVSGGVEKCSKMFPFILPPLWRTPALLPCCTFFSSSLPIAHSLSLNELPSDYWGLWRFIRNMCEGLEAANGKSFVLHPHSLPPTAENPSWWGRKALSEFWDINLLAFYRIFFSTERINRKKHLTLNHFV